MGSSQQAIWRSGKYLPALYLDELSSGPQWIKIHGSRDVDAGCSLFDISKKNFSCLFRLISVKTRASPLPPPPSLAYTDLA